VLRTTGSKEEEDNLRSAISFSRTAIHRIALLTLGTRNCLCACMVAELYALSVQQNKQLLSVEFS